MPGFLLHQGAAVICAHGGNAQPAELDSRVRVGGLPVATQRAPYMVSGCPFVPPHGNGPCVSAGADSRRAHPDIGDPRGVDRQQSDLHANRRPAGHRGKPDPGTWDLMPGTGPAIATRSKSLSAHRNTCSPRGVRLQGFSAPLFAPLLEVVFEACEHFAEGQQL